VDIYGNVLPLVFKLLDDDNWVPVSAQVMAVVFVKNTPENSQIIEKFKLTNDQVYNMMILRISLPAQLYRQNPYLPESLGDIFIKMGRREDAIKAYEYSLKRLPDNPRVEEKLNSIKKEEDEVRE
jgi:predicted Zn-dependent protease